MEYKTPFRHLMSLAGIDKIILGLGDISKTGYACGLVPPQALYLTGGLGCAVAIGLGLALGSPDRRIMVVEGDGSLLHSLSSLLTLKAYSPPNITVLILENRIYGSTGNHPLVPLERGVDLLNILYALGFTQASRCRDAEELWDELVKPSDIEPRVIIATVTGKGSASQRIPNSTILASFELMK